MRDDKTFNSTNENGGTRIRILIDFYYYYAFILQNNKNI